MDSILAFFTREMLMKFLKFAVVGFSGFVVDFSLTYICKELLKIQKYVSNVIGFCVAATTNYFLNRWWTFQSGEENVPVEYLKFFGVSLVGLVINTSVLVLLHKKFGWNFYFSKICAIAVTMVWNFFGNYLFTFAS